MTTQNSKLKEENKLKVDVYVPLNVCSCQWERFMNSVFQVLSEYNDLIKFETKNLESEEARKLNLHGNSVVINGKEIIVSSIALKQKIPKILKEKGMI